MRIRGEITHHVREWAGRPDRPLEAEALSDAERPPLNEDLYNPENAALLADIREHIMAHPQGILVDVYQAVTELELKHAPGTLAGQERYLDGLRGEINELHHELLKAFAEHPYLKVAEMTQGPEDTWLVSALDLIRLRFQDISPERKEKYLGELGDVLWYTARLAQEHGTSLSEAFIEFIRTGQQAPLALQEPYFSPHAEDIRRRSAEIFDAALVQSLALSQKGAFSEEAGADYPFMEQNGGRLLSKPRDGAITIDSHPHRILDLIGDELEPPAGRPDIWEADRPYSQLPDLKVTIGKLVWYTAYTAHTMLNAELSTVMKANLQKITRRSQHGTIFSRQDRTEADEAAIKASRHARMPVE
jgi:NTP pyrophosphatase (non-canonical NTP hydrolase)